MILIKKNRDSIAYLDVKTVQPKYSTIEDKRLIPGNLYPMKEIEIKSSISGTMGKTFVKVGERIKTGDRLAQIKLTPNPSDLEYAKRNFNTARINFDADSKTYERYKKLFDEQLIAAADFETFQKAYNLSKEQYISTQNQLTLLEEGFVKNQDISNIVKATTSGTIIDLPIKEGSSVIERNNYNDGTTLAVIARLDSFIFVGKVDESDVVHLHTGMKLLLNINAYKSQKRSAKLEKISAKGIEEQGVMKYYIEARFSMVHDTLAIRSGFTANAEVTLQRKQNVLAVEEKNILFQNDSAYVEVLNKEHKFEKRFITTGLSDGIRIEIIKGITKNDKIKVIE
jgi:HlyD family secretion protein